MAAMSNVPTMPTRNIILAWFSKAISALKKKEQHLMELWFMKFWMFVIILQNCIINASDNMGLGNIVEYRMPEYPTLMKTFQPAI